MSDAPHNRMPVGATTPDMYIGTVLGNVERTLTIDIPPRLVIRSLLGNVELDLRGSRFAPGVTELVVNSTLANIELRLPSDVIVQLDVTCFLGSTEHHGAAAVLPPPGAPVVRITGRAILGNVELYSFTR